MTIQSVSVFDPVAKGQEFDTSDLPADRVLFRGQLRIVA